MDVQNGPIQKLPHGCPKWGGRFFYGFPNAHCLKFNVRNNYNNPKLDLGPFSSYSVHLV